MQYAEKSSRRLLSQETGQRQEVERTPAQSSFLNQPSLQSEKSGTSKWDISGSSHGQIRTTKMNLDQDKVDAYITRILADNESLKSQNVVFNLLEKT